MPWTLNPTQTITLRRCLDPQTTTTKSEFTPHFFAITHFRGGYNMNVIRHPPPSLPKRLPPQALRQRPVCSLEGGRHRRESCRVQRQEAAEVEEHRLGPASAGNLLSGGSLFSGESFHSKPGGDSSSGVNIQCAF